MNTTPDAGKIKDLLTVDCRIEAFATTDSTNDAVLRMAQAALSSEGLSALETPLAAVSTVQTSGRGRLGRRWISPPGGLYLSVLLRLDPPKGAGGMDSLTALSPLSALAVRTSLQGFYRTPVSIKWPNDVITANGKLVGILVEFKSLNIAAHDAGTTRAGCVVFGIGVNVNRPEQGGFEQASYLDDDPVCSTATDEGIGLEQVAAAVLESLLEHFVRWQRKGRSFAPFALSYRANLSQSGAEVSIWNGRGEEIVTGRVSGIDDCGRLLVSRQSATSGISEIIPVSAGEVTLRQPHREK